MAGSMLFLLPACLLRQGTSGKQMGTHVCSQAPAYTHSGTMCARCVQPEGLSPITIKVLQLPYQ